MASTEKVYEVGSAGDLPPGRMKEVSVEGKKVLLANVGGEICAIAGECPHYGVSLSEGVLCGQRVVCPWHKAIFDVKSGALLEPPALDSLPPFVVEVRDGQISLRSSSDQRKQRTFSTSAETAQCFVLVGSGAGASAAAETLRTLGFTGRIVLLNPEGERPYDRTKVSKEFLSAKADLEELELRSSDSWKEQRVEIIPQAVAELDPENHQLTLSDGSSLHYDKLLLASGSRPKRLEVNGAKAKNVFLLHSRSDASRILECSKQAERAVVIGGSFIAMEAAASLRTQGLSVTALIPEARPFAKQLGSEVGAILQQNHERKGVIFEVNADVESFDGDPLTSSVRLKSGKTIPTNLVVVGIGVTPVTGYAAELPRDEDGGVLVDSRLLAAPDIYAAGDIAVFPESYSGTHTRIEHWRVAQQQGRLAAENMMGAAKEFDGVPYFWTNHFDIRFDYVGHADQWDDIKLIQDENDFPTFLALYIKDGRIVAAAGCQRDREICIIHEAMRLRRLPLADRLQPDPIAVINAIDLSDLSRTWK
jgi:apoptosis-inducing factor 3